MTVTTGTESVSVTFAIELLPFILDEQKNIKQSKAMEEDEEFKKDVKACGFTPSLKTL